jgi:hypothetical protein
MDDERQRTQSALEVIVEQAVAGICLFLDANTC